MEFYPYARHTVCLLISGEWFLFLDFYKDIFVFWDSEKYREKI